MLRRCDGIYEKGKKSVRNLFMMVKEDMRTTTGYNMNMLKDIGEELGLISLTESATQIDSRLFKNRHQFVMTPSEEEYRIGVLSDLLSSQTQFAYLEDNQFNIEELDNMVRQICIM